MSLEAPVQPGQTRIPLSEPSLGESAWTYVKDALDSGWVSSLGPYVDLFENKMARYFGVQRTVATMNGTAALHIALLLAGVQPGDEVIVPSMTFIASINAIRYVGAIPVFWDSLPNHWNADPALLESLLSSRTKAIMAVHLYGSPLDMTPVLQFASQNGLKVIEDAAEALGGFWQGQPCGSIGDIGCLSFNGNKVMTTGSGGLIISRDATSLNRAHYLVNQAKDDALTFVHDEVGYNYRLTNLQAALGVSQLESLPAFLERKRDIVARYQAAFRDQPALRTFEESPGNVSSCWLAGFAINEAKLSGKTSLDLVHALQARNIQSRPFFKPGHCQKPFLSFVKSPLPHAERWHRLGFNLPTSPSLGLAEQETVIATVLDTLTQWGA